MLGSLVKGLLFLIFSGACAFGLIYVTGLSGSLTLSLNESELRVSILTAIFMVLGIFLLLCVSFVIFNLGIAILRFLVGDETAISRYFVKSRQIKGNKALLRSLVSFYEGDSTEALLHSGRAKHFLNNSPLSLLINAQIAKQANDSKLVLSNYKNLLVDKETRLVALTGIVSEKIKAGDYEAALKLTKKSVQFNPKNINNINTLFNLQLLQKDWVGARETLQSKKKYEKMSRSVFLRQESILLFAEAEEKRLNGFIKEALGLALTAVRQYPSFVAALSFVTELELMSGKTKRVEKLLQKGWGLFPHPDIAKSYVALVENENAKDRRSRLEILTKMRDNDSQAKILEAELCLATKDFVEAKKLILKLVKNDPDNYTLTLMAAAEKGSGAPDSIVREWLAKAVYAPRTLTWICKNCDFQTEWVCICPKCDSFDTMEWRRPPFYLDQNESQAHLPFILTKNENDVSVGKLETEVLEDDKGNLKGKNSEEKVESVTVKQAREIS